VDPDACFDRVVAALAELARQAEPHGLVIGLENEHACNVGTGAEAARILAAVNHPNLKLVWDPCNAHAAGEIAYPDGYRLLPPGSIAHVHAKDCRMDGLKPVFGPLGTMDVDWKGQLQQLAADGYQGFISLETHWKGPGGDKHLASVISGHNLAALVTR
jgi:sugar phosphate isomerase/epimerase